MSEEVKHIPLNEILVDADWNARSLANVMAESSESVSDKEGTGLVGLKAGITNDGQDDPIVVRPTTLPFYKKTDKPYALVAGFRRFEAIRQLNADTDGVKRREQELKSAVSTNSEAPFHGGRVVPNTGNGTILAFVKNLSEVEARALNIRENTNRNDLSTQDLMWGIHELANKHKMSQVAIGFSLGRAQGYVGKLLRISTVNPKVLEHWRHGGTFEHDGKKIASVKSATTNDMRDLSDLRQGEGESAKPDFERQAFEYMKVLESKAPSGTNGGSDPAKQWLESAKKKAANVGTMLGNLQRDKFLKVGNTPWVDGLAHLVQVGKRVEEGKLNRKQENQIAAAAEKAFKIALEAKEETVDDEGDE